VEKNKDSFFDINLINDVIDGTVDEKTATEFFEHIKECPSCRKAYEEEVKIREIMKQDGFLPGTEALPDEKFTAKTMEKIREAKKPTIIRIIKHPAVRTAIAAAACILIAVFVFRSDLFGKIEGINGLANDKMANEEITTESIETSFYADSNGSTIDEPIFEEFPAESNMYNPQEPGDDANYPVQETPSETEPSAAADRNTDNSDGSYSESSGGSTTDSSGMNIDYSVEYPTEEESVYIVEEDEPCETFMPELPSEPMQPAPEPEPVPEPDNYIENDSVPSVEIPCEEPQDNYMYPAESEEIPATESASITENYDNDQKKSNGLLFRKLNGTDNETAIKVASLIWNEQIYSKNSKIIICYSAEQDNIDFTRINEQYPGKFSFNGTAEYNGNDYEAYTCNIYSDEKDYVFDIFGTYAFEVSPDEGSTKDYSDMVQYLILMQIK